MFLHHSLITLTGRSVRASDPSLGDAAVGPRGGGKWGQSSDTNLGTKPTPASPTTFPALGSGKEPLPVTSGHQWSPVVWCDGNAAWLLL